MSANLDLTGITAPSGIQYVGLTTNAGTGWLPRSVFFAGNKSMLTALAGKEVHLGDKREVDAFKRRLATLDTFPAQPSAEVPGWNGDVYALHDRSTFVDQNDAAIPVAFEAVSGKNSRSGTPIEWQNDLARPLGSQPIGALLMMLQFLPVLMRFMPHVPNFAVELVGPEGIGKSTLLQAVSTVYGGPGIGTPDRYWSSFAVGADALSALIGSHKDHPLLLDDINVLRTAPDKKAITRTYHELAHDLGRSESVRGHLGIVNASYRGVVIMAANESLRVMAEKAPVAGDQMITLIVPVDWKHGVFDKLPKRFRDGAAFAEAVSNAAAKQHGGAIRGFLRPLLADIATNSHRLQKRLDGWQERFLRKAGVNRSNGKELRTARAFAAAYAAGTLAKRYKILPGNYLCMSAALTCYQLHRASAPQWRSFLDRVEALIASDAVITISGKSDLQAEQQLRQAVGTLHMKRGYRELRIPDAMIRTAFPDWDSIKRTDAVKALLVGERGKRGQDKSKARLAPGLPEQRLYCFRLPLSDPSLFDDAAGVTKAGAVEDGWAEVAGGS